VWPAGRIVRVEVPMPKILSEEDIAEFREALCRVATERFARFGYDGVTMRQLAEDLGCSPKTPYRYFRNKDEIVAMVRAAAFRRFADALEAASADIEDPAERARRVGRAYVDAALADPASYRIMFDMRAPETGEYPELARESARARAFITRQAEDLRRAGLTDADPTMLGYAMWAAVHGLVVLQLAGMLRHGPELRALHRQAMRYIVRGAAPAGEPPAPRVRLVPNR
jgi:AcrR family transcriptional regulator